MLATRLVFLPFALAGAALLGASPVAQAQSAGDIDGETAPQARMMGRNLMTVGGAVFSGPRTPGSDSSRTAALPFVNFQWSNGWFAGFPGGVGYDFSQQNYLSYGLKLVPDSGRDLVSDKVDRRLFLGAFGTLRMNRELSFDASLRGAPGQDGRGLRLDSGMHYRMTLPGGLSAGVGLSSTWVNHSAMQYQFGVTPEQSGSSNLDVFDASGGMSQLRTQVSVGWRFQPGWSLRGSLGLVSLRGDARDSPRVETPDFLTSAVLLAYSF